MTVIHAAVLCDNLNVSHHVFCRQQYVDSMHRHRGGALQAVPVEHCKCRGWAAYHEPSARRIPFFPLLTSAALIPVRYVSFRCSKKRKQIWRPWKRVQLGCRRRRTTLPRLRRPARQPSGQPPPRRTHRFVGALKPHPNPNLDPNPNPHSEPDPKPAPHPTCKAAAPCRSLQLHCRRLASGAQACTGAFWCL